MSLASPRGIAFAFALGLPIQAAWAQAPAPTSAKPGAASTKDAPASPEIVLLRALRENPITAPYDFRVGRKDGKLVLSGRVGTKEIHDVAVRTAILVTPSIDDRIVIDTAAAHRVAGVPLASPPTTALSPLRYGPGYAATSYLSGVPPLVYPPPLFGRLDDPFYGFEPPIISYPPWWGAVAARRGDPYGAPVLNPYSPIGPDPGPAPETGPSPSTPAPTTASATPTGDTVEMTLDPRGVAVLRGSVPTMRERIGVGQKVARMEGVTEVINLLETRDGEDAQAAPPRDPNTPPPPPTPAFEPPAPPPIAPNPKPATPRANPRPAADRPGDDAALERRLSDNLARRPALAGTTLQSSVRDGVAYLSGKVPTALEAMIAFRAAQQTIGVRDVVDRLEFAVPDGQGENPLIAKGRPEDVEPYLEAQIRRQIGDKAHIDRVRVSGDRLEVRGTVASAADRPRIEAVLRSMPLLRGFSLDATLAPE